VINIPEIPLPEFSSGCVADRLDADRRRVELLLRAGHGDIVKRVLGRINRAVGYLRVNSPPAALAQGPVNR
jgi:hypothetical protein